MASRKVDEVREGVELTNLDGALFDGSGATKRDLVDYLDAVSDLEKSLNYIPPAECGGITQDVPPGFDVPKYPEYAKMDQQATMMVDIMFNALKCGARRHGHAPWAPGGRLRSCPPLWAAPRAPPLLRCGGHPTPTAIDSWWRGRRRAPPRVAGQADEAPPIKARASAPGRGLRR